ncbi:MAG: imidazole glycerol phosphate synthase subunit HisF [Bacillota bacterium]
MTVADAVAAAANTSNLLKRIIPCLDVKAGRVVKGTHFTQLRDAGDAVELARLYSDCGADELIFLDITATEQRRAALQQLVRAVAGQINIPFTVGGGINSLQSIYELLDAGADKVSLGTIAVDRPEFVREASRQFGAQCIVISLDAKRHLDSWQLYTHGGKQSTTADAVAHARLMLEYGAGELLVNSLDRDGAKQGFDIELLQAVCNAVSIPVIASSGAGSAGDFLKVFSQTNVDAALGATIFHYNEVSIQAVKTLLTDNGIKVRC